MEIRDSVGDPREGAANRTDDVETVQGELNMHLVVDRRSDRFLAVTGRIDSDTLRALDEFQRRHGLAQNGLIEPGDETARALSRYSGPRSMRVSHSLIEFLKRSAEGFRATPYNDAAKPPNATIGYGHELHRGPVTQADIERWGTITKTEAEQILRRDLGKIEDEVNRDLHVPLNQNQFDALVSLAFNISKSEFRRSTVLRRLNTGDYETAAKEFEMFDHVRRYDTLPFSRGLAEHGGGIVAGGAENYPPSYIYGRWVAKRLLPTSNISAGPRELNAMRGAVAVYSPSRAEFSAPGVSFGVYVVKHPKYQLSRESADEFFRDTYIGLREIGVRGDSVEMIDVRNADGIDVIAPGTMLYIRDKNHLVTLWDGGFFEMVRQK